MNLGKWVGEGRGEGEGGRGEGEGGRGGGEGVGRGVLTKVMSLSCRSAGVSQVKAIRVPN